MAALQTPFTGGVPAVFVHVSNLEKSVEWYSTLLGKPKPEQVRNDIHIFGLENGANIFLIQKDHPEPSRQVLCSLPAPDLVKTRAFFDALHIQYEDASDATIHFKDLDGNILMACSI